MHLTAGVDEVASETQLSEGWTYAVLPADAVQRIDAAVTACHVSHFHGKEFRRDHAADYETLLVAGRGELERSDTPFLTFTLLEKSWKGEFVPFGKRLISDAMQQVGVTAPGAIKIAEHLFPGLMTLQRFADNREHDSIEVEIDSDDISKNLGDSSVTIAGKSIETARLLAAGYEGYRRNRFPKSPQLGGAKIRALDDAQSRVIQLADVFGNFALAYVFVRLGLATSGRVAKAEILQRVFGEALKPASIAEAAELVGNDIQLKHPGGWTLRISSEE
jgi:hypothetical protein